MSIQHSVKAKHNVSEKQRKRDALKALIDEAKRQAAAKRRQP